MLEVDRKGPVAYVWLDRPEVFNAFNAELIAALAGAFGQIGEDSAVRAVVLGGRGKHFCAGADVNWMKASIAYSQEQNLADARRMAAMYRAINECPKPVLARIHGHALGGGTGLAAVCDYAVAVEEALFAFSEAKLGILPAVISNFVVPKIGYSNARAHFTTARRFDAREALRINLIHEVAKAADLDARVDAWLSEVFTAGPVAAVESKRVAQFQAAIPWDERIAHTTAWISRVRVSPEGQEGLRAFLEKRKPSWTSEAPR